VRVMALDPGSRRIGVAVSDELGLLASPVAVLDRGARDRDFDSVRALIEQYQPKELVIGLPLLPSGDLGLQAQQSEAFAQRIEREFGLPVRLWNESYSTIEAYRRRQAARVKRRHDNAPVDAEAAAIFLQDYLDSRR
jgi:putative holliday junction resolvase